MIALYSLICMIVMMVISYPYLKFYQMEGYKIRSFLGNILNCPISLNDKNRVVFTKRMIRFICWYAVVLFCLFIPIFIYISNLWLIFLDIVVVAVILPLVISFAHIFILPLEIVIKRAYIVKTKTKLSKFEGVKIAIVGSFGKTSVKDILYQLLNKQFNVVATPKNFNTPMGISKTVLEKVTGREDVLIFEMGAKQKGDIAELMDIVNPNWGIMTAVGEQHLETFVSLDNIKETKFELVKKMKNGGKIIFNGASENTKELYAKCSRLKYLTCDKKGFARFENPTYSNKGCEFTICIDNKKAQVHTKLLGKFNCENIVLASAMAYLLGMDFNDIVEEIFNLKSVKNRLELIDNGAFTIIDDSYNANIVGVKEALAVVNKFSGEKIVVSCGLVELGNFQYEKNFNLGKQIGKVADKVLIMNETNKRALVAGLKESHFDENNIYFANTRAEQKAIVRKITSKGCVILFQNDLPDNYK